MTYKKKISKIKISKCPEETRNENLVFSFKYLTITDKFCITKYKNIDKIKDFIERLRQLSYMEAVEIKISRSKSLRSHSINFSDSKVSEECFGIPNEDKIVGDGAAYQIQISTSNGRIHGFFTGNIFNIVWIDPEHKLYP